RYTEDTLYVGNYQVMQTWEKPIMMALARVVTENGGDILEVGFGLGISATYIQEFGAKSHTILEPHPVVFKRAQEWKKKYKSDSIILINDFWQNQVDKLPKFDGILYDIYTSDVVVEEEKVLFQFFEVAKDLLKDEGILTFFCFRKGFLNEEYQKRLLQHFSSITISMVNGLKPPKDCQYWSDSTMIIPKVVK
ncbi:MAG: class I SAM-dependent methyltransferase, partial [Methanosarcinales archaeon]